MRRGATSGPTRSPSAPFSDWAVATGEPRYGELALRLVDQVHHVLGRHRADDPRTGWISGLPEADGEAHPTRGGRLESAVWRGASRGVGERLERLAPYVGLRADIETFWLEPDHRRAGTWVDHENINDVMLATSLEPEGFLLLGPARG